MHIVFKLRARGVNINSQDIATSPLFAPYTLASDWTAVVGEIQASHAMAGQARSW